VKETDLPLPRRNATGNPVVVPRARRHLAALLAFELAIDEGAHVLHGQNRQLRAHLLNPGSGCRRQLPP
jgi:hypothetical protein